MSSYPGLIPFTLDDVDATGTHLALDTRCHLDKSGDVEFEILGQLPKSKGFVVSALVQATNEHFLLPGVAVPLGSNASDYEPNPLDAVAEELAAWRLQQ